ncbi:MAG: YggS family pyridoxal phosphate-dependent enzyme [Mariprofundus sp.]|nr:YggS family pyridoxal phosphate-dependent enzyme [Mariprofundus sp.]
MELIRRWRVLTEELDQASVKLLAVSKYAPDDAVQMLIDAGQVCFGESRAQNLRDRANRWPDCEWHMIGPVQKNKAKYVGRHASMWHSCENLDTAEAVARYVRERSDGEESLPVLIQVNIADVPAQHGIRPAAVPGFAAALMQIDGLKLVGLMCMAPKGGDAAQAFQALSALRETLLSGCLADVGSLALCMGMSGDYEVAIGEGATMVRLGSTLFGGWDVRNKGV